MMITNRYLEIGSHRIWEEPSEIRGRQTKFIWSSKTRAKEVLAGIEAENEFESRKLMQAILATHIGDKIYIGTEQLLQ